MATFTEAKPAGTPTWIDLMTPNADAARSFYQKVFGWEYDIGDPQYGGYTTARLGRQTVAGLMGDQPMPSTWNVYFATNAIDADVARAVELGATIVAPAMAVGDFGSMAVFTDPTGSTFSLWQADSHVGSQVTEDPGSTAWYELYSTNAAQARDFYTALLGATADPMPGGPEYYVLKHGDQMLAGIMQIDPSWGNFQAQWMTYFSVADVDETVATITANGGNVMGPIDDSPFGRMAAVADPSGAYFKVIEPPRH